MSKYFIIDEKKTPLAKEEIHAIEKDKLAGFKKKSDVKDSDTKNRMDNEDVHFEHTQNRIVVKVDIDYKDQHSFQDGTKIYIGRRFNNLNRRETHPVNAFVVSGEGIPKGAEILVHHNSLSDTNMIRGYKGWVNLEQGNSVRYFSIETNSAYIWRMGNDEWKPLKDFCTAYRVFEPYKGAIAGIEPTQLKNILYIRTGEYAGMVAHTLKACDHEIIFMGEDGREKSIIKCRHYEKEWNDREELIAISHDLTEKVKKGELLIGLSPTDCKIITKYKNV